MKKLFILQVVLLLPALMFSQITVTQSDMPSPGDTIRLSETVTAGIINYEEAGENITWDFSILTPVSQTVDTFVNVSETPWVYQIVFFTSSNLAQKIHGYNFIPGFDISGSYEFFKNSSSDFRDVGNGLTVNGAPIPNKYENPDIIYRFPMNYGDIDSSFSNYEMSVPGFGYTGGWKKRNNIVDGWGTLITPYGTFQTLRVKSDVIQHDSIFIDSLGIGFPIDRAYTEYKWLGNGHGLPLCTVTDNGIGATVKYIDSVRNTIIGVKEPAIAVRGMNIYPNPAEDFINIEIDNNSASNVSVMIFNSMGRKIAGPVKLNDEGMNLFKMQLERFGLPKGTYILAVSSGSNVYTGKFQIKK